MRKPGKVLGRKSESELMHKEVVSWYTIIVKLCHSIFQKQISLYWPCCHHWFCLYKTIKTCHIFSGAQGNILNWIVCWKLKFSNKIVCWKFKVWKKIVCWKSQCWWRQVPLLKATHALATSQLNWLVVRSALTRSPRSSSTTGFFITITLTLRRGRSF